VICLGLMDYYGKGSAHEYSEAIYQDYLEKAPTSWLGCSIASTRSGCSSATRHTTSASKQT